MLNQSTQRGVRTMVSREPERVEGKRICIDGEWYILPPFVRVTIDLTDADAKKSR